MSYNNTTGIISVPVSVNDVQKALGVSSGDVGTLCRSNRINMWSKCKPVNYPGVGAIHPWVAGTGDGPLASGIVIGSIIDTPENIAYGSYPWTYVKPAGSANSPYRLLDFGAYCKNAVCPVEIVAFDSIQRGMAGTVRVNIDDMVNGFVNSYNIRFSDFVSLAQYGSWRLTLAITDSNDEVMWYYFAQEPISGGSTGRWNEVSTYRIGEKGVVVGNRYRGVVMLTNIPADGYIGGVDVRETGIGSLDGYLGMSLGLEEGVDRFEWIYMDSSYITDVTYKTRVLSLSYEGQSGDVNTYEIGGLEFWVKPDRGVSIRPSDMEFKVEVIYEDGYYPDDASSVDGPDVSGGVKSRVSFVVVDWTRGDLSSNMTWDAVAGAYQLELGNSVYVDPTSGQRHGYVYLDKDYAYPREVTFKLWLRVVSSGSQVEQGVCSTTLVLQRYDDGSYYDDETP